MAFLIVTTNGILLAFCLLDKGVGQGAVIGVVKVRGLKAKIITIEVL